MQKQRHILNIQQAYLGLQSNESNVLVGVVLDASGHLKTKTGSVFQKIKLIDESWHMGHVLDERKPYLHVFNFVKDTTEILPIEQIGDIVLLYRFNYKLYDAELQAIRQKRVPDVKMIVFDAKDHEYAKYPHGLKLFDPEIENRIFAVRDWSKNYFSKISLLNLGWFTKQDDKPYDMLVKVRERNAHQLKLVNQEGDEYQLAVREHQNKKLKKGQVLKLRSITIGDQNDFNTNENSTLLLVPEFFLDSHQFNNKQQKAKQINIEIEDRQYLTQTKRKLTQTPMLDLIFNQIADKAYIIGQIIDIKPRDLRHALHIFYPTTKEAFSFAQLLQSPVLDDDKGQIVLHLQFGVRDESLELSNHVLIVNLIQTQDEPNFFDDQILDLQKINLDNFTQFQEGFVKQIKSLLLKSDQGQLSQFVVQRLADEKYKIIDTWFID